MVLPVPAMAMSAGGALPASTLKTISILFSVFLVIELALCAARFYVLDIWGGVIMSLITVFGAFVVKYEFDMQWTIMFGITLFFYGLIHFVMCIERMVLTWPGFPDITSKEPRVVVRDLMMIAAPIVDWTIVGLCYYVFKKATSSAFSSDEERQPIRSSITRSDSVRSAASSFTPFSGQGHKLG